MYKYQNEILKWLENRNRAALFLEQRLGKTYITIQDVINKRIPPPILIFAPYSAFLTWELALEALKETELLFLDGDKKERLFKLAHLQKWNIINYQTVIKKELLLIKWSCIILDESTHIKNPKTLTTKVIIKLGDMVNRKYILTGTPALEDPLGYFCQFRFLSPEILGGNFWEFRKKYCFQYGYKYVLNKTGKMLIAKAISENAYILKRKDVNYNNRKIYKVITVGKNEHFVKIEKNLKNSYRLLDKETTSTLTMLLWYRQLCGGFVENLLIDTLKLEALDNCVREVSSDFKIIIWASFKMEIEMIAKRYNINKIDGTIPVNKRLEYVKDYKMLVCNPEASRFGLNLSDATVSIFYSLPLSLTSYIQAEDRIVKPNTENIIYKLIRKDTVDEDIMRMHLRKENLDTLIKELVEKYKLTSKEGGTECIK